MLYHRVGHPTCQLLTLNLKLIMFYSREERIKKIEFDCEAIAIRKSLLWHCDVRQGG